MSTIDTMKRLQKIMAAVLRDPQNITRKMLDEMTCLIDAAIAREEAQPMEPSQTLDVCTDGNNCRRCKTYKNYRGDIPHAGIPVGNSYGTTPPSPDRPINCGTSHCSCIECVVVEQPTSGEREKLIEQLRKYVADSRFAPSTEPEAMMLKAADMLAADAGLRTQLARRTVERDMAIGMAASATEPAQQVAVPQGWKPVPTEPTHKMLGELTREWDSIGGRTMYENYRAMLAAAPRPPQADRVPMSNAEIADAYHSTSDRYLFARAIEAHHGIKTST